MALSAIKTYDSTTYNAIVKTAFTPPVSASKRNTPDSKVSNFIWDGGVNSTIYFRLQAPPGSVLGLDPTPDLIDVVLPTAPPAGVTFFCSVDMPGTDVTSRSVAWSLSIAAKPSATQPAPGTWVFVKGVVTEDDKY